MKESEVPPVYLSRLVLNPRSRRVRSELADLYEMHRTLMKAFPPCLGDTEQKAREKFNVLFRVDHDDQSGEVRVYVQSGVEPDWFCLAESGDWLSDRTHLPNPSCREISSVFKGLSEGRVLYFRLRANPTKRIWKVDETNDNLKKGQRIGLLREADQIEWLIRKGRERARGKPGGFEILMKEILDRNGETGLLPQVSVTGEGIQRGRKKEYGKPLKTSHLAVLFDGFLRITNVEAFRETLIAGIGPGKAFGFGLLSLAPRKIEA